MHPKLLLMLFWVLVAGMGGMTSAAAQNCSRASLLNASGATPLTEIIKGSPGQQIGICGYTLFASGNAANLQLYQGDPGSNCATNGAPITPVFGLPIGGILVDHVPSVALWSRPGASICFTVTGTGAINGMLYWTWF